MRNIKYIGTKATEDAFFDRTQIIWTPGKIDTVLDDAVATEMLRFAEFEDAGDSRAFVGAMSIDPTTGAMQIGGIRPTSAQRASVRAGIGFAEVSSFLAKTKVLERPLIDEPVSVSMTPQPSTGDYTTSLSEYNALITNSTGKRKILFTSAALVQQNLAIAQEMNGGAPQIFYAALQGVQGQGAPVTSTATGNFVRSCVRLITPAPVITIGFVGQSNYSFARIIINGNRLPVTALTGVNFNAALLDGTVGIPALTAVSGNFGRTLTLTFQSAEVRTIEVEDLPGATIITAIVVGQEYPVAPLVRPKMLVLGDSFAGYTGQIAGVESSLAGISLTSGVAEELGFDVWRMSTGSTGIYAPGPGAYPMRYINQLARTTNNALADGTPGAMGSVATSYGTYAPDVIWIYGTGNDTSATVAEYSQYAENLIVCAKALYTDAKIICTSISSGFTESGAASPLNAVLRAICDSHGVLYIPTGEDELSQRAALWSGAGEINAPANDGGNADWFLGKYGVTGDRHPAKIGVRYAIAWLTREIGKRLNS